MMKTFTSLMLISASTYWRPFCRTEMRAAGGTRVPLMFDWLMWLSMPNVNAEWEKPAAQRPKRPAFHQPTVALFQPVSKSATKHAFKHLSSSQSLVYISFRWFGVVLWGFTWLLQISVDQKVDFITGNAHLSSTSEDERCWSSQSAPAGNTTLLHLLNYFIKSFIFMLHYMFLKYIDNLMHLKYNLKY